jgi:hypothetical protein
MSQASFEQFREQVLSEASLQARLKEATELDGFVELVVQLGREKGYDVDASDVRVAWQAAQRAWLERWL